MVEPIEVRYHQSGHDFMRLAVEKHSGPAWDAHARAQRKKQLQRVWFDLLGCAGLGLILVEAIALGNPDWRLPEVKILGTAVGGLVGVMVCLPRLLVNHWRAEMWQQVDRSLREQFPFTHETPVTIRVSQDGLGFEHARGSTQWRWPAVRVHEDLGWSDHIITYSHHQILIPRTAFEDPGARERFLEAIRDGKESAGGDAAVIDDFLAVNEFACPSCKYPLGRTRGAKCPECGASLTYATVAAAYASAIPTWGPMP